MAQTPQTGRRGGAAYDFKQESEKLARRKKARAARRIWVPVVVLALVLAYVSGLVGTSLAAAEDLIDSVRISFMSSSGYPVQTGISELYQLEEMNGGFAALGPESCVVYSANGVRLRSIQPGYARPAIATGKNRFVIYNRSGTELRVESRTQNLYTQTYENGILLCEMGQSGTLAVVTGHSRYLAELTVYSPLMETLLTWDMVESEGTPVRMAFSSDERRLAMATLAAAEGRLVTRICLLNTRKDGETVLATVYDSLPLGLVWQSSDRLLVLYDDHAALYDTSGGEEKARYDFGGDSLIGWSAENKKLALLFQSGAAGRMVLLDAELQAVADQFTADAHSITLTRTAAYLCTDSSVECFSLTGEYQWSRQDSAKPLAVLDAAELLVFRGNTAELLEPPAQEE